MFLGIDNQIKTNNINSLTIEMQGCALMSHFMKLPLKPNIKLEHDAWNSY